MKKFFLGAMMLLTAVSMNAQTPQPAADASDKQHSEIADLIQTAGRLVQYGYATKQALPLIQAVQLYKAIGAQDETEAKQKTQEGQAITGDQPEPKNNPVTTDVSKLLADATTFAAGDKNLLALIKEAQESRGAIVNGVKQPIRHVDTVLAGRTDVYNITFAAGEQAIVAVSGDGDTDLDLYVYDENGNLIDSDTDNTDQCVCTFTPRWTGRFTIRIKNLGRVYNRYTLYTN